MKLFLFHLLIFCLVGCSTAPSEYVIQTRVAQTEMAKPSLTSSPTVTPAPTFTAPPTISTTPTELPRPTSTISPIITPTPIGSGNGYIVFRCRDLSGFSNICLINLIDNTIETITQNTTDNRNGFSNPEWSSDSKKIFYNKYQYYEIRYLNGYQGDWFNMILYSVDLADNEVSKLSQIPITDQLQQPYLIDQANPNISADGGYLAFDSNMDNLNKYYMLTSYDLYFTDLNSLKITKVTNCYPRSCEKPSWSPDGTEIVYQSNIDGDWDIYIIGKDSNKNRRLTNNLAEDTGPSWSPDGTKIAYSSTVDGNAEIYIFDLVNNVETRLTTNPATDNRPDWSPDGNFIVYSSDSDGDFDLYLLDISTSEIQKITNDPGNETRPSW